MQGPVWNDSDGASRIEDVHYRLDEHLRKFVEQRGGTLTGTKSLQCLLNLVFQRGSAHRYGMKRKDLVGDEPDQQPVT